MLSTRQKILGLGLVATVSVLVALFVGQKLAALAASGLALIMLLAALFHATRREYRGSKNARAWRAAGLRSVRPCFPRPGLSPLARSQANGVFQQ